MKTYARVENTVVMEIILPAVDPEGNEIPIEDRYVPQLVAEMVDITSITPQPEQGWIYDGTNFAPYVTPPPTAAEIAAANAAQQADLMAQAAQAMAPVLVSLQLDNATDAETLTAKAWQAYYRALQAVDLTQVNPVWPVAP